jgi:Skp family chaperone for outer membrane proteins
LPSWKINLFSLRPSIYIKICNNKVAKSLPKTGLCLELPTGGFISECVMPENQIPESGAVPAEFNFAKPATENPRMKRRSLKPKPEGLIKPSGNTLPVARELEREAPPLSAEQAQTAKPQPQAAVAAKTAPAVKTAQAPIAAPPRTTPSPSTMPSHPASGGTTKATAASTPTASPHGTRPAALYYSSRKDKEAHSPMKPTPTASPASASSATTLPSSAARAATASPRPATTIDYRANVDRQSREQKSVGNILAYAVYALVGFFVISAGLAIYGADVIFKQLHDQSMTVSDLDARYAAANKELNGKLATTQDTLTQAQAQLTRQQDLILRQQEELNRLIASTNDNIAALKQERQARTQETATLRARLRDLELRGTSQQKY